MAGLIAGDGSASAGEEGVHHLGVAPGAHVVSVKVAGRDGTTSLSRILDAIGWVIDHADEKDVRVLNLSFGVRTSIPWAADPLSWAVEKAWASGITVVVAAGNEGRDGVTAPGRVPWVITAGASDPNGTTTTADDTVPAWSGWQRTGPFTKPDVVAPGVSVISLRAPGSLVDESNARARIGTTYFRGSGTSMAAALTSGVAAVLLANHPAALPDDVKGALVGTARPIAGSPAGAVDLAAADQAHSEPERWQQHPLAGDGAGRPQRGPWSPDGQWSTSRWCARGWSTSRWYTSRWYSEPWSTSRWYTSRWYEGDWARADWTATDWLEDAS
jgi:serine protease AprX